MITVCPLCGLAYEPGGETCRERGCPLAVAGCRTLHCPRCGYAVPDEGASVLARWVRRLLGRPSPPPSAPTLADLPPGGTAVVDGLDGEPGLLARLTAQGLTPGVAVHLVQHAPSVVVEVGETTLALERRVAESVRIRPAAWPGRPRAS